MTKLELQSRFVGVALPILAISGVVVCAVSRAPSPQELMRTPIPATSPPIPSAEDPPSGFLGRLKRLFKNG